MRDERLFLFFPKGYQFYKRITGATFSLGGDLRDLTSIIIFQIDIRIIIDLGIRGRVRIGVRCIQASEGFC